MVVCVPTFPKPAEAIIVLAVKVTAAPAHTVVGEATALVITGKGFTITDTVATLTQPLSVSVPVTV